MIDFIVNNYLTIIIVVAFVGISIFKFLGFSKKTWEEKVNTVKEWAVYACALAEAELGAGTGALKLRRTYDMFVTRFPSLANKFSFSTYQDIAEDALLTFKDMLKTNNNVQQLIEPKAKEETKEVLENGNSENN